MDEGYCQLTQQFGRFVKCHIIPSALTRPSRIGANLVQFGEYSRPIKRWDSWYDKTLVTTKGETILAEYDDIAIDFFRSNKMIWSSWGPMVSLQTNDFSPLPNTAWGIRTVNIADSHKLRLFFISILWRAACSTLPEFAEIRLPKDHLERLRQMIIEGDSGSPSFYSVSLTQLSSMGIVHNHVITSQKKVIHNSQGATERSIFRIYFDGLIAHIQVPSEHDTEIEDLGPLIIGNEQRITFSTVTFEQSFQKTNLIATMAETYLTWPKEAKRLIGMLPD